MQLLKQIEAAHFCLKEDQPHRGIPYRALKEAGRRCNPRVKRKTSSFVIGVRGFIRIGPESRGRVAGALTAQALEDSERAFSDDRLSRSTAQNEFRRVIRITNRVNHRDDTAQRVTHHDWSIDR